MNLLAFSDSNSIELTVGNRVLELYQPEDSDLNDLGTLYYIARAENYRSAGVVETCLGLVHLMTWLNGEIHNRNL